jgi:Domain of unknown function (DUF222)
LRLSPGTAERRLSNARTLADRLPATLDLLRTGRLTYLHARKLAEAVTPFDDQTAAKIEARVLTRAAEQTLSQFAASLRRAVIAGDPRRAEQRHEDAIEARRVVFTPQDDGITELWALLPAEGAALIEAVLDSLASGQTDARSADQRRADALIDVFARVLGDPSLPEAHGQRPAINVTVSIGTLLGCDNQPAELDGYGPITAALARHLATDQTGTWRRLSPTTPANYSTTAAAPTGHQPTSPATSSPATTPAPSRDAEDPPGSATSTIANRSVRAVRQLATT